MKSGLSKRVFVPGVMLVALGLLCAHGQEKKAEPRTSTSAVQRTNSNSKSFKENSLNDLEKNIFGAFKNFGEDSGSEAIGNQRLPRPTVVPNKQTREILERRKNWAFMTPEELVIGRSTLEAFDLDGADKKEDTKLLSPMERYYQRLLNKDNSRAESQKNGTKGHRSGNGKSSLSPLGGPDEQDQDESLAGLPASVQESQRAVRANQEKDKKDTASEHHSFGFFSDVFALERRPSLEEQKQEHERLDAYRKSLGLDPLPTFGSPFAKEREQVKDPYRLASPAITGLAPAPSITAPGSATTPAGSKTSPFSDPTPKLAGSSSLSPAPPKLDPPKTVLPPNPTFSAPRRVF